MELAADLTPDSLREVLAELGERVAPVALARERTLPVPSALRPVFVEGGLVRGRLHASVGSGATTMAMAMVRDALLDGAWMAVVDIDGFGVDAAREAGIPLERVVRVAARPEPSAADSMSRQMPGPTSDPTPGRPAVDDHGRRWLEVMAAAADGFDVVLTAVPEAIRAGRPPSGLRSLLARIQQRGTVVVILGPVGPLPVDITVAASGRWEGLGQGHGVLGDRRLLVEVSGRRQPTAVRREIDLVADGRMLRFEPALDRGDPTAQVVAEMVAADTNVEPLPAESFRLESFRGESFQGERRAAG